MPCLLHCRRRASAQGGGDSDDGAVLGGGGGHVFMRSVTRVTTRTGVRVPTLQLWSN